MSQTTSTPTSTASSGWVAPANIETSGVAYATYAIQGTGGTGGGGTGGGGTGGGGGQRK